MKTTRTILMAAAAMLAMAAVSCTKDEDKGDGGETTVYTLELKNAEDADIVLENDETDPFVVELNTNLNKDQLSVTEKEGKDWCAVSIDDDCNVSLIPGQNTSTTDDLTATFTVSATGVEGVSPIEFNVTLKHAVYTVSIVSDDILYDETYQMYSYTGNGEAENLSLTVITNAPAWYSSVMSWSEEEWCFVTPPNGPSGTEVTISLSPNTEGMMRNATISFTYAENGYDGVTVNIMQNAASGGASEITISNEDGPIETGYQINAGAAYSNLNFTIECDGGINTAFVKPGLTEKDPTFDGTNDWIFAGRNYYDESQFSITIMDNETGQERAVDLIITSTDEDTELFRFKISQAGE